MGNSISVPNDVFLEVIQDFDLSRLRAVAGVNSQLRTVVKRALEGRIFRHLSPFIRRAKLPLFINTLRSMDSAIGGSVAQVVATPDLLDTVGAHNLNIYVPEGFLDSWETFFEDKLGYFVVNRDLQSTRSVNAVVLLCLYGDTDVEARRIVLTESGGSSCLLPILASTFTCQMNFVTGDHVFCMYPLLTINKQTFEVPARAGDIVMAGEQDAYRDILHDRGIVVLDAAYQTQLCAGNAFCVALLRCAGMEIQGRPWFAADVVHGACWTDDRNTDDLLGKYALRFWLGGWSDDSTCVHAVVTKRVVGEIE